ncbi:hypothetical protein Bbelb_128490 [Branchiostoma belcheri]|nr:hypothetical protein Bbelb_128490 [Branchiostoma belcheri]
MWRPGLHAPILEECTLKTGGTSAHLEECTLKPPTEVCRFWRNVRSKPEERPLTWRSVRSNRRLKCADFGGMYAQNRRNVRSPGGVVPILKTGGTSAHPEECTLKPPTEVRRFWRNVRSKPEERPLTWRSVRSNRRLKCADFGGMYAQNRRNVRSPGGVVPILKTGGTSAHPEECTLKPPTEVCRFWRNVRSKPEERPLTWRSVRSNRRLKCADFENRRNVRSPGGVVPILEECTLKTGGTSAHLEECTLKPPTEVCRFWRNVRSKPEERPLTWRSVRSNRRLKCADFGGMYAQNRRNVRSPGGVSVRSNRRLKCADFGGMYAQNRRNVRSPGGVYAQTADLSVPILKTGGTSAHLEDAPILEECTLKTGGTSAHLEECTLKPPTEVCRF